MSPMDGTEREPAMAAYGPHTPFAYDSDSSDQLTLAPTSYDTDNPDSLTKSEIERLGRERPALFSTIYTEASFVTAIVFSLMMSEYFTSGFNIILPDLTTTFEMAESDRTWPTSVPNLATAALLLPFARLCDQYGSRLVFLGGHAWLLIWSVASGFSRNTVTIIVCRAMQGVGFAALLPAGLALLGQIYRPGPRKNFVYSVYGAFACVGFYFGIFMAAISAQFINWRWYFWIGAFIELIIVVAGFIAIPRRLNDIIPSARMDWLGVCTIVPGLALTVFAFTDSGNAPQGWKTPYIYATIIIGSLFLCAAVYTQGWVSSQPLLPASIFRPKFMKRLVAGLFCYYGVFSLFLFYSSLYIENVLHATPIQAAAWYTPLAVGGVILAIGGGLILHLVSSHILLMISGLGYVFSVMLFALIPANPDDHGHSTSYIYWAYIFPAMCCGTIGMDIMFNVSNVFITTALPKKDQAAAGGVINSLMCLGIAFWLGITEVAISTAQNMRDSSLNLREQYRIGFWTGVGLASLALLLTMTVRMGSASADMTADEKAKLDKLAKGNESEDGQN